MRSRTCMLFILLLLTVRINALDQAIDAQTAKPDDKKNAAASSVGRINLCRVFSGYKKGQQIQDGIQQKFKPRGLVIDQEIHALKLKYFNLESVELNAKIKKIEKKYDSLIEEVEAARAAAKRELLEDILETIKVCANARKLDFVVRKDDDAVLPKAEESRRPKAPAEEPKSDTDKVNNYPNDTVLFRRDSQSDYPADVSNTVDVTDEVLEALNSKFEK